MNASNLFGRSLFLFAERIAKDDIPAGSMIWDLDRYWQDHCRDGRLPSRQDIDPTRVPVSVLPWIFLLDVLQTHEGLDYRFRLVGTSNVELVGRDATGYLASEIFGTRDRRFMMQTFDTTVQEAVPTYWRAAVPHDRYGQTEVLRALYPLAEDGRTVNMLLCIALPEIA